MPPRGRAGALPSAGCWLSTSVNQQTLPRACSGLSTFLRALGRVWGRKSEALLIRVAWTGRPEAPGTTRVVRRVWGPPHVSHLLCCHCPIFLLFLENVPPPAPWPAFNVCLTPQSSPCLCPLQTLLGPPGHQICWVSLSFYLPGLLRASEC